jgi:hypothetical protein
VIKLLLDEHISQRVAAGLRVKYPKLFVRAMTEWNDGRYLGQTDDVVLQEAASQGLTLVTYDRRTIPPLLKVWAEEGHGHGGVIFVDEKTMSPADMGGLVKALARLIKEAENMEWTNRVCFLRR